MKNLQNYNISSLNSVPDTLDVLENQILILSKYVGELEFLSEDDRIQLASNIDWLKNFYEHAEKLTLHDEK
jgi:hypothetical protein